MYASTRVMHARLSRLDDAVRVLKRVTAILNEKAGTNYRVSVNLGNEPGMVLISGRYDHLDKLEAARKLMRTDPDIALAMRLGDDLFLHGHENEFDHIEKVHTPAGEPKEWVSVRVGHCAAGKRNEALAKGVEIANCMSKILGVKVGFASAITGDLNRAMLVCNADTLLELEKDGEKLEANEEYQKLIASAQSLFDSGVTTRSIWQRV